MSKADNNVSHDQELDALFDAMKAQQPEPSEALVSAILRDAEAEQTGAQQHGHEKPPSKPHVGIWTKLVASIGGWPAVAGMATATVAGIWIGFAAPTELETLSGGLILSGDYVVAQETYALDDLSPAYLGSGALMEDEG
ncbi:hypothetical protein [Aliiroseovarius sp. 2305UL8-7]|uniref:hypothetical protein n=1 Tax=Aliiroseovarius conchicola TaxID=3121637 RepID=UPI0035281F1E